MLSLTSAVTMLAILTIIPSWLQQYRQRWHLKPQMARAMEAKILGWHYWQCWHYLHGSWCYYIDSTTNSDILTLDSYTSDIIDAGTLDPARDFGSVDPYEQVAQWIATVKYSLCTKVESVFWCTCITHQFKVESCFLCCKPKSKGLMLPNWSGRPPVTDQVPPRV